MDPSIFVLRCMLCHREDGPDSQRFTCESCGGPIEARYDYENLALGASTTGRGIPVDASRTGVWRYSPLLPINAATRIISLGEGATPSIRAERISESLGMKNVYVKDETRNPTLSFKDRKATVAVTKAAEFKATAVASMTAGNAGSSVAAYAAKGGIDAYVFTIDGISDSKLAKLLSYGAKVFKTRAPTRELVAFVGAVAKKYGMLNLTAASRYNPYVKEGAKTAVFEIFEGMGGKLPQWIILPVGGGGNLSSIFKGLWELKMLGLIERYPRLVGVQGKDCAPVVEAFERGLPPEEIPSISDPHTIAHSILDSWAPDGDQAVTAIRETKGFAIGVSDEEILDSMRFMSSREGLYVEPAAASPLAALRRLTGDGRIGRDESVVMVATGCGANQPEATLQAWGSAPSIGLDVEAFAQYVQRRPAAASHATATAATVG